MSVCIHIPNNKITHYKEIEGIRLAVMHCKICGFPMYQTHFIDVKTEMILCGINLPDDLLIDYTSNLINEINCYKCAKILISKQVNQEK